MIMLWGKVCRVRRFVDKGETLRHCIMPVFDYCAGSFTGLTKLEAM